MIEWRNVDDLHANHWNPNRVAFKELELLEHSILKSGWLQPIIINNDNLIIDGFHRWRLSSESAKIRERWDGRIPCVVMDIPDDEAMAQTVRINKAKGKHITVSLQDIIQDLHKNFNWDLNRIQKEFGMTEKEVSILLAENVFDTFEGLSEHKYSQAWYPSATASSS